MPGTLDLSATLRIGDLAIRRATLDDANLVADILTARTPDDPTDPRIQRHRWESDDPDWTIERFVIETGGAAIGYAWYAHAPWSALPRRYARIGVAFSPRYETAANLGIAHDVVEDRARRDGAATFMTKVREDLRQTVDWLVARGYREERRQKDWRLDLVAGRDRLLALRERSRARMREVGVAILTLAADADPDKYRKLHEMGEEAAADVPTTIPFVRESFEQFMKWFRDPGIREGRTWIAREGDDVVGVSVLSYPPVRGNVWTDWTGTARSVRGRGVARALKLETVGQAIELGATEVRTANDAQNAPILHLNELLGYTAIPGGIQLFKDV